MWRVFSLSLFVVITVDGWCYRCILCFMVGCYILLFLWNMNWGIEIMALIVVFLTRLCFTYNWIWINVCTLDNPLFMRDPMCCEFISGWYFYGRACIMANSCLFYGPLALSLLFWWLICSYGCLYIMHFSVVELFVALAHYGNFLFILMTNDTMVIWFMLWIVKIYGYWDRLPFGSWCQVFLAIYTLLCCFLSMEKGDTFRGLLAPCFWNFAYVSMMGLDRCVVLCVLKLKRAILLCVFVIWRYLGSFSFLCISGWDLKRITL